VIAAEVAIDRLIFLQRIFLLTREVITQKHKRFPFVNGNVELLAQVMRKLRGKDAEEGACRPTANYGCFGIIRKG
jgi:hypothetical protein